MAVNSAKIFQSIFFGRLRTLELEVFFCFVSLCLFDFPVLLRFLYVMRRLFVLTFISKYGMKGNCDMMLYFPDDFVPDDFAPADFVPAACFWHITFGLYLAWPVTLSTKLNLYIFAFSSFVWFSCSISMTVPGSLSRRRAWR